MHVDYIHSRASLVISVLNHPLRHTSIDHQVLWPLTLRLINSITLISALINHQNLSHNHHNKGVFSYNKKYKKLFEIYLRKY
jgi:hypothetical protein